MRCVQQAAGNYWDLHAYIGFKAKVTSITSSPLCPYSEGCVASISTHHCLLSIMVMFQMNLQLCYGLEADTDFMCTIVSIMCSMIRKTLKGRKQTKMEGRQSGTYLRQTRASSGPRGSIAKTYRDETKRKWIFRPLWFGQNIHFRLVSSLYVLATLIRGPDDALVCRR